MKYLELCLFPAGPECWSPRESLDAPGHKGANPASSDPKACYILLASLLPGKGSIQPFGAALRLGPAEGPKWSDQTKTRCPPLCPGPLAPARWSPGELRLKASPTPAPAPSTPCQPHPELCPPSRLGRGLSLLTTASPPVRPPSAGHCPVLGSLQHGHSLKRTSAVSPEI